MHRVLDTRLLLLHFGLGGRADLDQRHAADQLGQPLLELLPVVVRGRVLDLGPDLPDAACDGAFRAGAFDDRRVFLRDDDLLGPTEIVHLEVFQLDPEVLEERPPAGKDRDVLHHGLPPVTEAGGLDRRRLQGAAQLVHDQGGQSLALDVLRDHAERPARLGDLLQHRKHVLHAGDLLLVNQHEAVLEDDFHPLAVGDEVRREVAAVELHALDDLELGVQRPALLDLDDAVLADLLHRLGDDLADLFVAVGGDRPDLGDHVPADFLGPGLDLTDDGVHGAVDAAFQLHRVPSGGDVPEALGEDRLGEDRRGGGPVTGDVGGLGSDLADHLGADVLNGVFEVDFLGDGDAVLGHDRRAEFLLDEDVASLGAEGHPDGRGQLADPAHERLPGILPVVDVLGHGGCLSLLLR